MLPPLARALREGRALVSLGLLANLAVDGRFHVGDLATGSGPTLRVKATVQGPSWSQVDLVTLFADGVKLREQPVEPDAGSRSGTKVEVTWEIPRPGHDVYLVALASGPGVTSPFWAIPRPYQPTSRSWTPRVLGVANPIYVDGDGDGAWTSPKRYAQNVIDRVGMEAARLLPALAAFDEAIAAEAAGLCHSAGHDVRGSEFERSLKTAPEPLRAASPRLRRHCLRSSEPMDRRCPFGKWTRGYFFETTSAAKLWSMAKLSSGNAFSFALQKLTLLGRPSTETGTWTLDLSAAVIIFIAGRRTQGIQVRQRNETIEQSKPRQRHHPGRRLEPGFREVGNLLAGVGGPLHDVVAVLHAGNADAIDLRQFLVHGLGKRVECRLRIQGGVRQLGQIGVERRQSLGHIRLGRGHRVLDPVFARPECGRSNQSSSLPRSVRPSAPSGWDRGWPGWTSSCCSGPRSAASSPWARAWARPAGTSFAS